MKKNVAFVIYVAVATAACIDIAIADYPSVGVLVLAVSNPLLQSKAELSRKISRKESSIAVVLIILFVAVMLWAALSGSTAASNRWFRHSTLRPAIAFLIWNLMMAVGFFASRYRQRYSVIADEKLPEL